MYETVITFLIFLGVIAVASVLFCVWAAATVFRGVVHFIGGILGLGRDRRDFEPTALPREVRCGRPGCAARNPASARFCRRCGKSLATPDHAAAAW